MSSRRSNLLALATLGACTSASPRTTPAVAPVTVAGDESRSAAVAPPTLTRRFEQFARQLASDSVRYDGVAAAGFITKNATVTTPFEIPAGSCVSIVALASPGVRDLDAHVFSPDGELVVEDTESDPHPTVQLCATAARRVYHVLEAYEGEGAYAIAVYTTDHRGLESIARVVGGHPGTAMSAGAGASDAERRLAELREGIARRGFAPSGELSRLAFPAAGSVRVPVPVTPDRCYTLAALAEGTLTDTDLSVFDADGEEIARDVRPERDALVQLCPSAAATLALEVRARPGPGVVLVQPFAADAAAVGGANTLWLGERMAWSAQATTLAQSLEATRQSAQSVGLSSAGAPSAFVLAPGESRELRTGADAGRCTTIAAVAGRGLGRLSVHVRDGAGELLARGVARNAASYAVLCPSVRETCSARVRAEVGTGEGALLAFSGPALPAWAGGVERQLLSETLATQIATQLGGWRPDGPPERMRVGARALRTREAEIPAGSCVRFAASVGRGLPTVLLGLRSGAGQLVAESSGEGTAIVTRCARTTEHVRVELGLDPPGAPETDALLARYARADRER